MLVTRVTEFKQNDNMILSYFNIMNVNQSELSQSRIRNLINN